MIGRPPRPPLFPSTTLFRSHAAAAPARLAAGWPRLAARQDLAIELQRAHGEAHRPAAVAPAAADSSQRAAAAAELWQIDAVEHPPARSLTGIGDPQPPVAPAAAIPRRRDPPAWPAGFTAGMLTVKLVPAAVP